MDTAHSPLAERFSLVRGGLVDRLRDRFGPRGHKRERVVQSALLAALIAWLPLLILSMIEGLAYSTEVEVPFLRDFAVNVRFLLALPILILAGPIIDRWWRRLVLEFPRSGLVSPTELPAFEAVSSESLNCGTVCSPTRC